MHEKNRRRLVTFLIGFFIVLGVGAIFSTYIYENSAAGIGRLIGELVGAAILPALIAIPARRTTYAPAVVLVVAAVAVGIINTPKLIESIDARRGMKELSAVRDPSEIEQALKKNPSNKFLQLMAGAAKLAKETDRATATRADLQAYLNDLRTAETNAAAAMPRFDALVKKERDDVESLSRSLNV